jgi:1-acyl-sn-glycerol-3-phosphate acyltransferase
MYLLVKVLTHFTIWLTCKRFSIFNKAVTATETPLVLGCHHPNSFLDAILIGAQMKKRVHFLTRSDVFQNKFAAMVMRSVNMIPIYRIRDGKDNLSKNDVTFELCREIIKKGEHVLIFVEGFCLHQTTLQTPLKKRSAPFAHTGLERWGRCEVITGVDSLQFLYCISQRSGHSFWNCVRKKYCRHL